MHVHATAAVSRVRLACIAALLPLLSLSFIPALHAQSAQAHLIPQTIFVGDSARLVVPLDSSFLGVRAFVREDNFPIAPNFVIRRIELERRGNAARLLIDFTAYAPGSFTLPPLDFLFSGTDVPELGELHVQVTSILDPSMMMLSEPALPLSVPGTSLLVYGSIIAILVLLLAITAVMIWGRRTVQHFWQQLRQRHRIRAMLTFLHRLGSEANVAQNNRYAEFISMLCEEFREFLTAFSGLNCRSLSAKEFLQVQIFAIEGENGESAHAELAPAVLSSIFRTWDTLRFSGKSVQSGDFKEALQTAETFVLALDGEIKKQGGKSEP